MMLLSHHFKNMRRLALGIAVLLICPSIHRACADTLSMTAYYPSPDCVYYSIQSTTNTALNYCPASQPSCTPKTVYIGVKKTPGSTSVYALDVEAGGAAALGLNVSSNLTINGILASRGGLQPGTASNAASCSIPGLIQLVNNVPMYCDGSAWKSL